MNFKVSLKWYDIWIGVYIDVPGRKVYVCPFFCIVFEFPLPMQYYEIVSTRLVMQGLVVGRCTERAKRMF